MHKIRKETDEVVPGYLYVSASNPWPSSTDEIVERVPEDWVEEHRGIRRVKNT
jgi:hypothetical protein